LLPVDEILAVEVFAVIAKAGDDLGVREAVVEHDIYFLANFPGQSGDFSPSATGGLYSLRGGGEGRQHNFEFRILSFDLDR
jgi:hypothetical protein